MKRLLFFIAVSLFSFSLFAQGCKLKLEKIRGTENDRTEFVSPVVSYEKNVLYIHSDNSIDECSVTVKNGFGEVVFSEIVTLYAKETYRFSIGDVKDDVYVLELKTASALYRGYFEVFTNY